MSKRLTPGSAALHALLLVAALLWIGPYLWMVSTSLKTLPEIVRAPAYPLPASFNTAAYREVAETIPVGRYFFNTVAMATLIALLQTTADRGFADQSFLGFLTVHDTADALVAAL